LVVTRKFLLPLHALHEDIECRWLMNFQES
jgi:hypothetical protein